MHPAAMEFVRRNADLDAMSVLDIGGRDVNGSPRPLFAEALPYLVLDALPGPDVDVLADASTWTPSRRFDVVLALEVFEHTPDWPAILCTAYEALNPGGQVLVTMAGPGRAPHSAHDGAGLRAGEYYGNVEPYDLHEGLTGAGFTAVVVNQLGEDVRATARRPA